MIDAHSRISPNCPHKSKHRAKALQKTLCNSPALPEDHDRVMNRTLDVFSGIRPRDHWQSWLTCEVTILNIHIERNERTERRARDKRAIHAELFWDDDRKQEAMVLAQKLGENPEVVLNQLKRTPQGCEWLMDRWAMLAYMAKTQGQAWTADQTTLAFDLLGTPTVFRDGRKPGVTINYEGDVVDPAVKLSDVAIREIALLRQRREYVAGLDEVNRSLAEADLAVDNDPELVALRKESEMLHRRLRWCMAQMRYKNPHEYPAPGLVTRWLGLKEPSPRRVRVEPMPPAYDANKILDRLDNPETATEPTSDPKIADPDSENPPESDRMTA